MNTTNLSPVAVYSPHGQIASLRFSPNAEAEFVKIAVAEWVLSQHDYHVTRRNDPLSARMIGYYARHLDAYDRWVVTRVFSRPGRKPYLG